MKNSECNIHIEKPGLLTEIQDLGRCGHQSYGIPVGGVLDRQSAMIANLLVGNKISTPLLEITYIGPTLFFDSEAVIAICGANISPVIDQVPAVMNKTLKISGGSRLSFGKLMKGCRCYVSIQGKWNVPKWLNSTSPLIYGKDVSTSQNRLKKQAFFSVTNDQPFIYKKAGSSLSYLQNEVLTVHVLEGPEFALLQNIHLKFFQENIFTLSKDCNRMGCRLLESLPNYKMSEEMLSSGIIPGTVQLTNSGNPILLLADAQTTGGYPRVLQVIYSEMDRLAQLKPGDKIRFSLVTLEESQTLNQLHKKEWTQWKNLL